MTRKIFQSAALLAISLAAGWASAANAVTMRPVLQDTDVQKMVDAAKKAIDSEKTKGCIAVSDADGEVLYLQRQEGAPPNCLSAVLGKVKTAAKFQTPTEQFHKALMEKQPMMLVVPELTPLPGGVPLVSNGSVMGAVAISTPDPEIDVRVVKAAVAALK